VNELNSLTLGTVPVLNPSSGRQQDYKLRFDRTLVRLVHESVQRRAPYLKVGKRVALEYVLLEYLKQQELLNGETTLPGVFDRDPLTEGRSGGTEP
jgi:hypothetical protein